MAEADVVARKWGDSSIAVVIPKNLVVKSNIKDGDRLRILIEKETNLSDVFGTLKSKTTGQKFKNMCKKSSE